MKVRKDHKVKEREALKKRRDEMRRDESMPSRKAHTMMSKAQLKRASANDKAMRHHKDGLKMKFEKVKGLVSKLTGVSKSIKLNQDDLGASIQC